MVPSVPAREVITISRGGTGVSMIERLSETGPWRFTLYASTEAQALAMIAAALRARDPITAFGGSGPAFTGAQSTAEYISDVRGGTAND